MRVVECSGARVMDRVEKRTVSLPRKHAAYIDELVASGANASASEVVRAGLRARRAPCTRRSGL